MAELREARRLAPGSVDLSQASYGKLRPGPGKPASEVANHQRARIRSAMVEAVSEHGYNSVTARGLARRSGVSTRTFYEHFKGGKEECFLHTYELVVGKLASKVAVAQEGERNWEERLRLACEALASQVEHEPREARFVLIEAYHAGPAVLEQVRRTECTFGVMLAESLARVPDGIETPSLLTRGMVEGLLCVLRSKLLSGDREDLHELTEKLLQWVLSYRHEGVTSLTDLSPPAILEHPVESVTATWLDLTGVRRATDRALILAAVAKLAAADGYDRLTPSSIRTAAGISRRRFDSNFSGAEDCFIAAVEWCADDVFKNSTGTQVAENSWIDEIHHASDSLCTRIAQDPIVATLCFGEALAVGPEGVRCCEHLRANIFALIHDRTPAEQRPDDLVLEASAGAVWGVLHDYVVAGRSRRARRLVALLSYLALAPAIGASEAIRAICRSHDALKDKKHRGSKLDQSRTTRDSPTGAEQRLRVKHVYNRN